MTLSSYMSDDRYHDAYSNWYAPQQSEEHNFIDAEFARADSLFGIQYDYETFAQLLKRKSPDALQYVRVIRDALSKKTAVSLDTVILGKVLVHNLRSRLFYYDGLNDWTNWDYPLPASILYQIEQHDPQEAITKELFLLLREEILICNGPDTTGRNEWELSTLEVRKLDFSGLYMSPLIVKQLKEVRGSLLSDTDFREYHHLLPPVKSVRGDRLLGILPD